MMRSSRRDVLISEDQVTTRSDHTLVDRDGVARNTRALMIHQPWASLIARGTLRVVNRSWTPPADDLALGDFGLQHARKTFDLDAWGLAVDAAAQMDVSVDWFAEMGKPPVTVRGITNRTLRAAAMRAAETRARKLVPFSARVGVSRYIGVLERGDVAAAGRWYVGLYGWAVDEATAIAPVPLNGAQG